MLEKVKGRIIVKVNVEQKNSYQFGNGQKLILFPNTNQFDKRHVNPTGGIVISAEEIPIGSEVLLEHNACHPVNEIFDYKDDEPNIKYYSVPEMEVYVWREKYTHGIAWASDYYGERNGAIKKYDVFSDWQPTKYYAIGERVFKPYKGSLVGIEPELIKNTLFIKTGEFKDKIVHTLANSDYVIIYQDADGKPKEILTCFHCENETELEDERINSKEEIVAIRNDLTEKYLNGELYTGLTKSDCKLINKNK